MGPVYLILALVVFALVLLFGLIVIFGPPYLPTKKRQIKTALDLLDLKAGQTLLELGSGDGRIMRAAAQRGLNVVGIELNPLLVLVSRIGLWRYRKQVRVVWGNYFSAQWPQADGIFTFMIQRQMTALDTRIRSHAHKPVRLASFAFYIPGKKPVAQKNGVFLYEYKQDKA